MLKYVGTIFLVFAESGISWVHFILIGREIDTASDLQKLEISNFNDVLVTLKFVLN